jgi:hypothetical protein
MPALWWARLFNQRYAILLANLTHALTLPGAERAPRRKTIAAAATDAPKLESLIRWCRDEMTLAIAPIARYLTLLPIDDRPDSPKAGAPFELDGTGPALPDDEKTRWCAHQRLIDETRLLIKEFRQTVPDPLGIITAIEAIDRSRADFIALQLTHETKKSLERADAIAKKIDAETKARKKPPVKRSKNGRGPKDEA